MTHTYLMKPSWSSASAHAPPRGPKVRSHPDSVSIVSSDESNDASKDDDHEQEMSNFEDGDCAYSVITSLSSITDSRMPRNRNAPPHAQRVMAEAEAEAKAKAEAEAKAEAHQYRFVAERPLSALDDDDDDEIKSYQDTDSRLSRATGDVLVQQPTRSLASASSPVGFRAA